MTWTGSANQDEKLHGSSSPESEPDSNLIPMQGSTDRELFRGALIDLALLTLCSALGVLIGRLLIGLFLTSSN